MTHSDPIRWLDDEAGPLTLEQREALRDYSRLAPSPEQNGRIWSALHDARVTGISPRLRSKHFRWWWGGALGVAAGVLWWALAGHPAPARPPLPQRAAPSMPMAALPAPAPTPEVVPLPEPAPVKERPGGAVQSAARRAGPSRRVGQVAGAAEAPDPAAELSLLSPARQLMATHPARALALTDEHAQRFPHGVFAEERAFLRIEALLRLGRTEPASREAERFRRQYPRSTYLERLRQLSHARP
jgi:hypothetical protein